MDDAIDDLIYGGRAGDLDEIRAALAAGAPVDGRDANGTTALMMASANGHLEAMKTLLEAGADINATNARANTALHWAVFTAQQEAVKALLAAGGCDLTVKNEQGCTAAMDAERAGQGDILVLILNSLDDEDAAADVLDLPPDADDEGQGLQLARPAGVDKTLDGSELKVMQQPPTGGVEQEALPPTRGVLTGETLGGAGARAGAGVGAGAGAGAAGGVVEQPDGRATGLPAPAADESTQPAIITRERPLEDEITAAISRRVQASAAARTGDWRYSVLPAVVPVEEMVQLSTDFFAASQLLTKDGNTFGPGFENQYAGHRNYFYYVNRNRVVEGSERAAAVFEQLDAHTRQVVELHHPGATVRLERAFGAYYESGEARDGFHRGVNEHCDGDANLVSTVVHATLPDGQVGFTSGGELTVSAVDALPAAPITHSNDTIGTVVYLGGSVFHHASPINHGGRRLVFCMFYACDAGSDLSQHALAGPAAASPSA